MRAQWLQRRWEWLWVGAMDHGCSASACVLQGTGLWRTVSEKIRGSGYSRSTDLHLVAFGAENAVNGASRGVKSDSRDSMAVLGFQLEVIYSWFHATNHPAISQNHPV